MDDEPLDPPYTWCDSWCERCPLRERCPIVRIERERRWQKKRVRDEDANSMAALMEDFDERLGEVMTMLEEIAEADGIDLDDLELRPAVPSLAVERFQRAGVAYAVATRHAIDTLTEELDEAKDTHLSELIHQSTLVARKCGLLASYVDRAGAPTDPDGSFALAAVPNLLLIELALRRSREAALALFRSPASDAFEKVHADLERILAPLLANVPASARDALEARIANGEAPSPFCVVAGTSLVFV